MSLRRVVFAISLSLLAGWLAFRAGDPPQPPRLTCQNRYSVDSARVGEIVEFPIVLGNVGGSDLEIRRFSTNCSCTAVMSGSKDETEREYRVGDAFTIESGGTRTIKVRVAVRGEVGRPFRNLVRFETSDAFAAKPTIEVVVKDVFGLRTNPNEVLASRVGPGILESMLEVSGHGLKGPKLSSIRIEGDPALRFDAPGAKDGEAGGKWSEKIRIRAETANAGLVLGKAVMTVSDKQRDTLLEVPIRFDFKPLHSVSPASVTLPRQSSEGPSFDALVVLTSEVRITNIRILDLPEGWSLTNQSKNLDSRNQFYRLHWNGKGKPPALETTIRWEIEYAGGAVSTLATPFSVAMVEG